MRTVQLLSMCACVSVGSIVQADVAVFSDTDFDLADWSVTATRLTNSTYGINQVTDARPGDPTNAVRSVTQTVSGGYNGISLFHGLDAAVHDPAADGPINSIAYSYDARKVSSSSSSNAIALSFALMQDGVVYTVDYLAWSHYNWINRSNTGLLATDFTDGANHPDFSSAGEPIAFGYLTSNSSTLGSFSTTSYVDAYSVNVDYVPVPEPASLSLLAVGGLALLHRR